MPLAATMDMATIWLGPEVETVEAVNYFGMDNHGQAGCACFGLLGHGSGPAWYSPWHTLFTTARHTGAPEVPTVLIDEEAATHLFLRVYAAFFLVASCFCGAAVFLVASCFCGAW